MLLHKMGGPVNIFSVVEFVRIKDYKNEMKMYRVVLKMENVDYINS